MPPEPNYYTTFNNRLMKPETYYYYNHDGNVTRVVTKNLFPGPSEKPYTSTWLTYAINQRAVTFAVGEEWDVDAGGTPTDYNIVWGREYRYDQARARYLNRVLDPDELQDGNIVPLADTWSQYDGDVIYSDYTISGEDVTVTAWYEPGIGMVKNVDTTPTVTYYHDDLIGTTRFMTDASGNKIEGAVYTAFGELVSGSPRRFGYAGAWGYQTDELGRMPFLHVGHRYYNPATGRFLQRDPIGIRGGTNVYIYVQNRPTVGLDPVGLQAGGLPSLTPVNIVTKPITLRGVLHTTLGRLGAYAALCALAYEVGDTVGDAIVEHTDVEDVIGSIIANAPSALDGISVCFVGGTQVHTQNGPVVIEELTARMEVLGFSESTDSIGLGRITRIFACPAHELVHIELQGEKISCTREHPFSVLGDGWVKGGDLKVGSRLRDIEGQSIPILKIWTEKLTEPVKVYNITVDGQHTYFIGRSCVLVHNKHQY
jgi:RHS repeat-associated protein